MKALRLATAKDENYPSVLVLEYAANRPGDIAYLCSLAQPDIAVVTAVSPVHAEYFASIEELAKEIPYFAAAADGVPPTGVDLRSGEHAEKQEELATV